MIWRPVEKRPRGRPRTRWEDQIHEDIKRIGIEDWRGHIQDRKTWAKTIGEAKEHGRIERRVTREKTKAE
jgi:hypothetical protein